MNTDPKTVLMSDLKNFFHTTLQRPVPLKEVEAFWDSLSEKEKIQAKRAIKLDKK